ncbi:serine/threonine-protein phosphatase [Myceligenerans sp. I2]|uniref:Serine/threonine-protein phosphatase n=2 Tax=Myceligenerans indicum TaxID=2593663 RepID=A0ABS1LGT9_9MICO|nr:serine/threonine-protein phosphatase [Myceligenerans indicum]
MWGAASDRGRRRKLNEDAYLAENGVFLVADGMGGHDAGDIASATALGALSFLLEAETIEPELVDVLVDVAQKEVRAIETGPKGRSAGTTLTGAVLAYVDGVPYWLLVNVGDSRTYLLSNGELEQMSVDHSEVQELVDAGVLTAEEARHHPRRNVITRALGGPDDPDADFRYVPVEAHERILVCSDGLTAELDDEQIREILLAFPDPGTAAQELVASALEAGGRDNVTVLVVDVTGVPHDTDGATAERDCDMVPGGRRLMEDTQPRNGG